MAPTKKKRIVTQPYLKGSPIDRNTPLNALQFLGGFLIMLLLYLMTSTLLTIESAWLRILVCVLIQCGVWSVFFLAGRGSGTASVKKSESFYDRQESGRQLYPAEIRSCFHPLKGFINAFIGSLPILIAAIVFAIITTRQTTGFGSLPSWLTAYEGREEIGPALSYYHSAAALHAEDYLRILFRFLLMPVIGIFGSKNAELMLMIEHLSPVLMIIPAICYGAGFTQGPAARTELHTKIAANNRKRALKEKKDMAKRHAAAEHVKLDREELN